MRLLPVVAAGVAAFLLVASSSAAPARGVAGGPISAQFLFDLADGTYYWMGASIQDPAAQNATWNATLLVARALDLNISWVWYAFGGSGAVFITDVGNRSPPGGVGLYTWNATAHVWVASLVGISDIVLHDGDALALYDAGYAPITYAQQYPAPTPDHPFPVLEFRGDSANTGQAPEGVGSSPPGIILGGGLLWDRNLNLREIEASPTVAGGRVFVLALDGLFALSESTGSILWSNPKVAGLSTPAFFNETLILSGSDGKVHSINAMTGAELWNTTLIASPGPSGITSSPKVVFDTLYVGTFNESGGAGEVVALWATNGTVIWRHTAPGSISFSTPAVVGDRLFVGVMGRYNTTTMVTYDPPYGVLSLNAANGSQNWFHATGGSVAGSPLVWGDNVYAPSKDGRLYCLDAANGTVRWNPSVQAGVSSPSLYGRFLYVGGGSFGGAGRVSALDAINGTALWSVATNGPVQSSVTTAGNQLFLSTNAPNGTVYSLDRWTGAVLWAFTPSPAQYIFSTPVVADREVFAASDNGHVYAFGPSRSLLDLSVTGPASLAGSSSATLNITVRATRGSVSAVTVHLDLSGLSAQAASRNGTIQAGSAGEESVVWQIGQIPFNGTVDLSVHVRADCSLGNATCDGRSHSEVVNVTYLNFYGFGGPYSESGSLNVTLGAPGANPPPGGIPLWIPLVIVFAVTLALVSVVLVRRRRPRHGP